MTALKKPHDLTELQLQIMNVVWDRPGATVAEVHEALAERTGLARKTIGTIMARLEQQGMLAHAVDGREFVYRATVSRGEVRRATARTLLGRLFGGDLSAFVSHALEADAVEAEDVERARELLERWERERRRERKKR